MKPTNAQEWAAAAWKETLSWLLCGESIADAVHFGICLLNNNRQWNLYQRRQIHNQLTAMGYTPKEATELVDVASDEALGANGQQAAV